VAVSSSSNRNNQPSYTASAVRRSSLETYPHRNSYSHRYRDRYRTFHLFGNKIQYIHRLNFINL
jgi:hypothetical protein